MNRVEAPSRPESATERHAKAFVAWLEKLVPQAERHPSAAADATTEAPRPPNRAALAALRRSLGHEPGQVVEACPYVDPLLPPWAKGDAEAAFYLTAGLFGWHPDHRPGKDLGGSFAELDATQRGRGVDSAGTERRFVALLNADRDDLPEHLRHAVALLRADNIPLDYARLLHDLLRWDHPDRFVRRRWARSFWSDATVPAAAEIPASPDTPPPASPIA